jgi:GT2 family glycosyltransferase
MFKIGLVVPVFQKKFILSVISRIMETNFRRDLVVCVVNDGKKDVAEFLSAAILPQNVMVLDLPENLCFAGANNAGWRHITEKFPSIKYLGSLNDDTIPQDGWLDELVAALERYPQTAVSMPVMDTKQGFWGTKKTFATWELKDIDTPMIPAKDRVKHDTFVPVINGFCFLALREALEDVDFFNDRYRNSCEDVDLSLRLTSHGWRMVVCKDAHVFHFGGSTRYVKEAATDLNGSRRVLESCWGSDLRIYNNIRPKTAVHCCAYNQEHFIEAWVRNAAAYADEIVVMHSKQPWNYNKNARQTLKPDATGEILSRLKEEFSKLIVIEGDWDNETAQRTEAVKLAAKRGAGWLLIVDSDEFFQTGPIMDALDWMAKNPADKWSMCHVQLIKQKNWAVVTSEGTPQFQFAINLATVKAFKDKRTPAGEVSRTIPAEICKCWHFSYLMPEKNLREKLASFGHAHEIAPTWQEDVWPNIKPGVKNFHPVNPAGWKEIIEVKVPQEILNSLSWIK